MNLGALTGSGETAPVTGFAIDHRKVAPGTVFGAFRGARFNGEDFIPDAVSSGAVAVVSRPEAAGRGRGPYRRRGAAARIRPAGGQILPALPGDDRRGHRHQRQDLERRAGPPALADGGPSVGEHRHAGRHHLRRAGDDRAHHARHRHLPLQHGRAGADGDHPRRVRGVEPRPVAIPDRGAAGARPPPSPISAATISTITRRCRPISRPRCGCSRTCSSRARRRWSGPTIAKSDEVIARCMARGLDGADASARGARR